MKPANANLQAVSSSFTSLHGTIICGSFIKGDGTEQMRLPSPLNHNTVERVASDGRRSAPLPAVTGPGTAAAAAACKVEIVEAISARCSALLTLVARAGFELLSGSALRGRRFPNPKSRDKLGMQPFGAGDFGVSIFKVLPKSNASTVG